MAPLRIRVVTRGGAAASPARRFVVGSLVVHVALAAALILIPGLRRGPRLATDATVVELVGGLPGPRTVAPPTPPAPEPPQPDPPAPVPTPPPKDASVPKPASKQKKPQEHKSPAPAATPAPAAATPAPEPATTPPGAAAGGAGQAGSAASGASVSTGDLFADASLGWYRSALANALYGAWKRPIVSGLTQPVEVRVAFEIMRDGNVRGLRIEESSGVPMLDRSALRAVGDASPLPALPPTMSAPYVPASIVFRLYPEGAQG